jgi:voltage-gated potassium channel
MNTKGKIFLFGYGSFGRHLYKHLSKQNNNIKVITSLEENVEFADENVDIVKINIRHNDDIKSLNINPKTDIIYCSMNKTANNLFLVLTLKTLYRDANIISISNSYENTRKLKYAGATNVIDLYEATSRRFVHILTKPAVTKAIDEIIYKQNDLKMAEVVLPPNSVFEKKYVNDINFKSFGIVLIAIIDKEIGNDLIFIDHRVNHKLDAGDTLVVVAKMDDFDKFKKYLYKDKS